MSKITCNVIRDIMPLYVDDVLSYDSRKIFEEHIQTCKECREYHDLMKSVAEEEPQETYEEVGKAREADKRLSEGLRRKLNVRRVITIAVTACVAAAVFAAAFYFIAINESYMTYEESGIYVEGDTIKTSSGYYCSYGFDSPDPDIEFVYLTTTVYQSHRTEAKPIEIYHMNDDESGDNYKKVYYLTEEYAKKLSDDSRRKNVFWNEGEPADSEEEGAANYRKANLEKIAELEKNSTLIWEAE
ncbi:MAG: zf-HC2 domain-containing protein [Firmicutes bacterium]|nr:zf-HC2 domain-containing protein [Bacillota bacterium]